MKMNDDALSDDVVSENILEAYMDASAAFQGLTIEPGWRPSVRDHLEAIKTAAQLVLDFPLDDEIEAAPIYQP